MNRADRRLFLSSRAAVTPKSPMLRTKRVRSLRIVDGSKKMADGSKNIIPRSKRVKRFATGSRFLRAAKKIAEQTCFYYHSKRRLYGAYLTNPTNARMAFGKTVQAGKAARMATIGATGGPNEKLGQGRGRVAFHMTHRPFVNGLPQVGHSCFSCAICRSTGTKHGVSKDVAHLSQWRRDIFRRPATSV